MWDQTKFPLMVSLVLSEFPLGLRWNNSPKMKSIFFYALSPQGFPRKYYQYHLIYAQISRCSSNHNNVPRTPYLSNFNTTLHGKIKINYNNNTTLTIRYCDFIMIAVGNNLFFPWGRVTFATKLHTDNTTKSILPVGFSEVLMPPWARCSQSTIDSTVWVRRSNSLKP